LLGTALELARTHTGPVREEGPLLNDECEEKEKATFTAKS